MASIAVPGSDAVLVYKEELAHTGMSRVFLWLVRRGEQERPVRVHLDHMGEWVLSPAKRERSPGQAPRPGQVVAQPGLSVETG
jgi:hypothetical protein